MARKKSLTFPKRGLFDDGRVRLFTGDHLAQVAFPLGGIGTGTISLGGRGNLRDWEIFNRPAKGKNLPMTFFAVWAKPDGDKPTAKILERKILPPYHGSHGFDRTGLQGVARLDEAVFRGEYPFAWIEFQDKQLPVQARLEAFNPFIPLNVEDSSIPVAIFNWTFHNPTKTPIEVSLMATMQNPIGWQDIGVPTNPFPEKLNQFRRDALLHGLWFSAPDLDPNDPNFGTAALCTPWAKTDVQTRLYRGGWWDSCHILWDDFADDGRLESVIESEFDADVKPSGGTEKPEVGAMAMRATIAPGESMTIPAYIAWHFPFLKSWTEGIICRTYAGVQFADAWDAATYAADNMDRLTRGTREFHGAIIRSTLPGCVLDAVTSQASIIRSNTCIRLADGQFYGYEGCSDNVGCCAGTCMHVWNYEQALAFLFPTLERSIRRNEFLNSTSADGHMQFRTSMPANTRMRRFHACADGQMGAVIRAYRDWQLSGDDAFLEEIWPNLKRALGFAWTQPNGWDPNRDGVMEGCQHNTYDIEFYGPNTMMGAMYLGALRAAEEMANYLGEKDKAREYHAIYESGRERMDAELWNGDYYVQKVEVMPGLEVPEKLRGPQKGEEGCSCKETPGPKTPANDGFEVKYQYGEGCLSDQLLGQWACHVAGLGYVLDPKRVKRAVGSIFKHNFRHPIGDFSNVQRIYALNDEAGLLLCSWPRGNRPALPFVYSDEVWTGIEYQVAAHLIYEGLVEEGLTLVKGVRDRHDGLRRNPWNEFECGSHYARAMASWSVLLALSGFGYSATDREIRFRPVISKKNFRCFFSTASGWGTFSQEKKGGKLNAVIAVAKGKLSLQRIELASRASTAAVILNGRKIKAACQVRDGRTLVRLLRGVTLREGQILKITLK
ncbi:MAG: hypothetical protein GXP25_03925 [Planctomycetes bacterium]|nr:hypothetical protein [Planctomycetota bacterium]